MSVLQTAYYGRHKTTRDTAFTSVPDTESKATVYDRAADNLWITSASFFGGRASGDHPDVRIGVYNSDASKDPTSRVGYFAKVQTTNAMTGAGAGGNLITAAIEHADNAPTNTALMLFAGKRYAIDLEAENGQDLGLSVYAIDFPDVDNPRLYRRTTPGDPPADPFVSFSSQNGVGWITAFLTGYVNNPPEIPTGGLSPSGTVSSNAPTVTADFDDNNGTWGGVHAGANVGDRLSHYQIQARQSGTTSLIWNTTYAAIDDEVAADQVSRAWGGSALTRGTTYEWRIRYSDQFGEYGGWSAWTSFTPAALGFVTLDSTPTGKITTNQPNFNGRWNHQAATSMKRVQVRILSKRGTVLQTGADYDIADVASSALPGTLFTVNWTNAGLSTLSWGQSYQYQIRGYDGTQWSDWSAARTFNTNAAPRIANHLTPNNSQIITDPNGLVLRFTLTDADDDYLGTLVGKVVLVSPVATTALGVATYNPTNSKWELTGAGLASFLATNGFGGYTWYAYGYDGTLYSGEQTVEGNATHSAYAYFDYEAGPVVAISSPTDGATLTSAVNTVAWSVTSGGPQVKYRVIVYADGDSSTIVYDSGTITSTATSHEIPAGYLRNNTSYDIVVAITNGTPVTGYSPSTHVSVAFTAPADVTNLQLDSIRVGNDPFPTANRLTWDASIYGLPDYQYLTIYRSADGGPDAGRIILARITSPDTASFTDYTPASGYEYTYEVTVSVLIGADVVESAGLTATATITLSGVVLSLMGNGGTYRACLLNVMERPDDRQLQEAVYQSPAESKPTSVRSAVRYWVTAYSGRLIDDAFQPAGMGAGATARERRDEVDALDAQNGIVCARDGKQIKRFGKITNLKLVPNTAGYFDVAFGFREEAASEGVV